MPKFNTKTIVKACIFSFFAVLLTANVYATTLLPVSSKQLSSESELIFEGRVVDSVVKRSADHGVPFTYVQFEVLDVITGSYAAGHITLGFAGGTLDGMTYRIDGIYTPQINERGVYFVETLSRELLHPLTGWHQGHYVVIQNKSSVEQVLNIEQFLRLNSPKSGAVANDASSLIDNAPSLSDFRSNVKREATQQ